VERIRKDPAIGPLGSSMLVVGLAVLHVDWPVAGMSSIA
jgi:hypothetical protein